MNCAYHNDVAAVSSCPDCGKGLCPECTSKFEKPICADCNLKRLAADHNQVNSKFIPSIIMGVLGIGIAIFLSISMGFMSNGLNGILSLILSAVIYGYIFAGIPWGWKVITFITPKMFLFLSFGGWVIYFSIKFLLAFFVGIVAMPIGIIHLVIKKKDISKKESYTNEVK